MTFLCALALVAAVATLWAIRNDSQLSSGSDCQPGAVEIKTAPIPDPPEIEIVVLNGTDRPGLADQAAVQLEDRGFVVVEVGDTDEEVGEAALVKYGPEQYAAGLHTHAYFYGGRDGFNLEWEGPITIVLGNAFKEARSTSDARQSFALGSGITLPEGTCAVE
ncbi:LytR C-terminal domain-containing protein [Glycomyces sp. L485]|uniref:LytR C-terminal domain-containing protein n=1 Tax=Glycomyces sp. L485 TaxID=2909235 RepID=UPI001F4AB850|nr:LytR C-terminal domain-containing protein [Glycomyces sp. L485]MCH7232648.1 LytR C-terminal domain-containing protein [Glycomyces sp. L485]